MKFETNFELGDKILKYETNCTWGVVITPETWWTITPESMGTITPITP